MGQLVPIELDITKEDFLRKLDKVTYKVDLRNYTKEKPAKRVKSIDETVLKDCKFIGEIGEDNFSVYIIYKDSLVADIKEHSYNLRDLKNEIITQRFNAKLKSLDDHVIIESYRSAPENIYESTLGFLFPISRLGVSTTLRIYPNWLSVIFLCLLGWAITSGDHGRTYSLYGAITSMILLVIFVFYKILTVFEHRKTLDRLFISMVSKL